MGCNQHQPLRIALEIRSNKHGSSELHTCLAYLPTGSSCWNALPPMWPYQSYYLGSSVNGSNQSVVNLPSYAEPYNGSSTTSGVLSSPSVVVQHPWQTNAPFYGALPSSPLVSGPAPTPWNTPGNWTSPASPTPATFGPTGVVSQAPVAYTWQLQYWDTPYWDWYGWQFALFRSSQLTPSRTCIAIAILTWLPDAPSLGQETEHRGSNTGSAGWAGTVAAQGRASNEYRAAHGNSTDVFLGKALAPCWGQSVIL